MLVFPKNAETNASTIEKGLDGIGGWVRHHGSLMGVGAGETSRVSE